MEARVQKLELSLQELQEEVRQMRASAPVAGHHRAATPPTVVAVQPKPGEAEDLDANGAQGDLKVAPADSKVDDWEIYEFQRSIWDASMFVGLPPMGTLGSAAVCMLMILTVAMQLVFCALINDHLTYSIISEAKVEELRAWRVSHAHNIRYMDTISMKSMARQVCDKESVIWSEGTKALLATIDEYISFGGVDPSKVILGPLLPTLEVGPLMCVIALLVWYMTLLKDFEGARAVARAMELLPRGPRTRLTPAASGGGTTAVECLSHARLFIALATVLVRCWVHLVLLWSGSLYLVHTISLSDLILNAVALEVVLTLDSVVYEAFVPHDSKKFIGNLLPLPKPRKPSYKGVDVVSAVSFTCAMSLAVVMLFVFILPQVDTMKEARDAMCGGNVDFVSAFSNNGLLVVHPSLSEASPSSVASYEYQSVREAIFAEDGLHPMDHSRSLDLSVYGLGVRGSQRSVKGLHELGVAWATLLTNSFCTDYDPGSYGSASEEALLRSTFNFNSSVGAADFCSHPDVLSECFRDTPNGVRARQYCPVACGCAHPASSLILTHPDEGCPATCTNGLTYQLGLAGPANCTDQDTTSEAWQAYGQGMQSLNASWTGEWQTYLTDTYSQVFGDSTLATGCTVVLWWQTFLGVDLCDSENAWRWKPLTYVCPETCKCSSDPTEIGCPFACAGD